MLLGLSLHETLKSTDSYNSKLHSICAYRTYQEQVLEELPVPQTGLLSKDCYDL